MFFNQNTPDLFFLLKTHWKVPNGSDSVSCWQVYKFLNQALFLWHKQDGKTLCYAHAVYRLGVTWHISPVINGQPTQALTVLHLVPDGILCESLVGNVSIREHAHSPHCSSSPPHACATWMNREKEHFCCAVIITECLVSLMFNCKLTRPLRNKRSRVTVINNGSSNSCHCSNIYTSQVWSALCSCNYTLLITVHPSVCTKAGAIIPTLINLSPWLNPFTSNVTCHILLWRLLNYINHCYSQVMLRTDKLQLRFIWTSL